MTPDENTRLLVADHRLFYAEALADALGRKRDLVATASDRYDEVAESAERFSAAAVLLGISPGEPDVFRVAARVREHCVGVRVLFIDEAPSDIVLEQAERVGARGFLLTSEPLDAIVHAVQAVVAGRVYVSPALRHRVRPPATNDGLGVAARGRFSSLTTRQLEILRLLARGRSVKEVARSLDLSEKSVDSHKYRIMSKLDIHDRVELARYAIREGLVTA